MELLHCENCINAIDSTNNHKICTMLIPLFRYSVPGFTASHGILTLNSNFQIKYLTFHAFIGMTNIFLFFRVILV